MKKTKVTALVLATVMAFSLFSGCTKTQDPGKEPPKTDNPAGNQPTDSGKTRTDIVIGESVDIVSLDPIEITDNYSAKALWTIHDNLIKLNENTELVPWLAESYEEVTPTEYLFHIRKGVKFHNGEELKASDVKFSLDRVRTSAKQAYLLEKVSDISVVDDYTVKMTLSEVYAPILLNLSESQVVILNEKAVKEGGDKYAQNPVGTGPMKFDSWKPNDYLKMTRNEEYWAYKPAASSITIKVIPEASSRTIALETGEVDFISPVPPVDIERVSNMEKIKADKMVSSRLAYICINMKKSPFDNVKVRQALSYLTDKETIIDAVLEGNAIPAESPLPTIGTMYNKNVEGMYPYDAEKGKALMAEAGFPQGFSCEVAVSSEDNSRIAQVLQSTWSAANVTLDINMMEFGAMLSYLNTGAHDMVIMAWSQGNTNPDKTLTNNFHSAMVGASGNRSFLESKEVDGWIEGARRTTDTAEQKALYDQVQQYVMDNAIWIPLYQSVVCTAYNSKAEGIIWYKHGGFDYTNMVIKE